MAAAAVGTLLVLRPGFVAQAATSPRAWLTVAGVLLLVLGSRHVVRRAVGPRAATAAGLVVAMAATALLIGPSFRQRTLNEPLPAALQQPAVAGSEAANDTPAVVTAKPTPTTAKPQPPAAATPPVPRTPRLASPAAAAPVAQPAAPPQPTQPVSRTGPPERQLSGELRGIDHSASGQIILYTAGSGGVVRFQDVDIEGSVGPSVHLVPTGERRPEGGIRLGSLKAERGSFSYRVPDSVELRDGWTVLIWCDPYNVPIASADPA